MADATWVRCARCGCQRRVHVVNGAVLHSEALTPNEIQTDGSGARVVSWRCSDTAFCTRAAGVGLGVVDADEGGP